MTSKQFALCLALAQSERDLSQVDDSILDGCAMPDYGSALVTKEQVAKMLRWHCKFLNGHWDSDSVQQTAQLFVGNVKIQLLTEGRAIDLDFQRTMASAALLAQVPDHVLQSGPQAVGRYLLEP